MTSSISRFLSSAALAAILLAAAVTSTRADSSINAIVIDPDGGGRAAKMSIGSLQFGAGNSLLHGAIPFTTGNGFRLLVQAQLNSVVNTSSRQVVPDGLNGGGSPGVAPYEITMVLSVAEQTGKVATNFVRWDASTTQPANSFIEIYYDPNLNANPGAGTGYNDGLLILRATPSPNLPNGGMFSLSNPQPNPVFLFDLFNVDDRGNTASVWGIGATKVQAQVTYVNPGFFVTPANGDIGHQVKVGDTIYFDIGQGAPYDKVDPSVLFVDVINPGTNSGPAPAVFPSVGTNNGVTGPDMQLQALASASFLPAAASPTPTPSATPTPTVTPTPSVTPTPTVTPTATPSSSPAVSVSSDKSSVNEGHDATITFKISTATHPDITINYTTTGTATFSTDYTVSGTVGQVLIPANQTTATVAMHALTDSIKDDGETVRFTVGTGTGYQPAASPNNRVGVTINDVAPSPTPTPTATPTPTVTPTPTATATPTPSSSPTVSVNSDKSSVNEGHDATITFKISAATHPDITVNYTTGGTATFNTDYTVTGTAGQVLIPANQATASVTLHAVTDSIKDGGETARFFVGVGAGYVPAASPNDRVGVTIQDPP